MKTLYAREYGVVPDTLSDSTQAFERMLAENVRDTRFILEKGRYDFFGEHAKSMAYSLSNTDIFGPKRCAVLFRDMHNIDFVGNGAEFVFHGQVQPFTIDRSSNISLRNVVIDWDIPLTAEGSIIERTDSYIDIRIDQEQFPCKVKDGAFFFVGEDWESPVYGYMEFDKHTRKVAYLTGDNAPQTTCEEMAPGHIRFHGNFRVGGEIGNWVVLRHNKRTHAGVFAVDSSEICLEGIVIHCTGGLGILAQFCENLSFRRVQFIPNEKRGRRIISGHDDGIHLSNNKGSVLVEECCFHGLMDDPINIHGTSVRVIEKKGNRKLLCRFMSESSIGFPHWARGGDEISFIDNNTMASIAKGIAAHYELISNEQFVISFESDIPELIDLGDALENLTQSASLICRNNHFGSCRARGLLVSTPKPVRIENNVFESSGSAILIAGDANHWYESGACNDVVIRNNTFSDCCLTSLYQFCEGIISIYPEIPEPKLSMPFHRNIHISHNTFLPFDYPVLYAKSVENLSFSNNRIIRSHSFMPWHLRKHMLTFEYCNKVKVEGNLLVGNVLGADAALFGMDKEAIDIDAEQGIMLVI